jgi:monofunctional biosynthetic peptidoglycan transglycosylase
MRKFLIIVACCAGFYLLLFQAFRVLTNVEALKTQYPKVNYDAKTKTDSIEIVAKRPATWTNLNSASKLAVGAIVLSEDWAFYQHNGFDWEQIRNSAETNFKKGKFARGGSTITQQVAKNVFLSNEKTIWRKVQEAVLAVRLERNLGKARILEIYLNIAEFGEGLYGIGPAARYYFKKSPAELSAKEGAFLAMLLPSPVKYSVSFRKRMLTRYAASTVRSILGKLAATHRLSPEQYQAALATPLSFEARATPMASGEGEGPDDEEVSDEAVDQPRDLPRAGAGEGLDRGREEERLAPAPLEETAPVEAAPLEGAPASDDSTGAGAGSGTGGGAGVST